MGSGGTMSQLDVVPIPMFFAIFTDIYKCAIITALGRSALSEGLAVESHKAPYAEKPAVFTRRVTPVRLFSSSYNRITRRSPLKSCGAACSN